MTPSTTPSTTTAADAAPGRGHLPALDGLRGLAIALVLAHNLGTIIAPPFDAVLHAITDVTRIGWIGVELFFALSGFLITGILLDTRGRPGALRAFYARRSLRIFPLYYVTLVICLVVLPRTGLGVAAPTDHDGVLWYWLYLANWFVPVGIGVPLLAHTWSLCVEEQFYLVWPAIVQAVRPRALLAICGALVVAAPIAREIARHLPQLDEFGTYTPTICRMDALALGAIVAIVVRDAALFARIKPWAGRAMLVVGLALLAIAATTHGFDREAPLVQGVGESVLAIGCALAVLWTVVSTGTRNRSERWLSARPLRWLGKYSYAIYMFHVPLHAIFRPRFVAEVNSGGLAFRLAAALGYELAIVALSILAALISWHLLEKRMLALKRYFPEPTKASPAGPAGETRA